MYVLDTNTLICFFKGMGRVPENLLTKSPNEICIPAIVLYELEYGISKSSSPEKRIEHNYMRFAQWSQCCRFR